jgi:2-(1,2-epoxy-1,2-dihydrophenyl)acetyl-CoA isomerase
MANIGGIGPLANPTHIPHQIFFGENMTDHPQPLLVHLQGHIKTLTFNLEAKKNPISPAMLDALAAALAESQRDGTRVLVLTGAGGDFSAGADLSAFGEGLANYDVTGYLRQKANPVVLALRQTNLPVIAKVRGVCVGLAFNLALACDMVFANQEAKFSQIFVRIGLSSDGGGGYFMPRLVGYQKAFELMATGAMISAEEGAEIGFVNHVLADEALDATVQKMAERLANGPFVAIQQTKANLRAGVAGTLAETLDTEAVNQHANFQTEDFHEGVSAFLAKRKPNFKGK